MPSLLDQSENHIEYRLEQIRGKYDLNDDAQRIEFMREAIGLVSSLHSAVEREVYGGRVAEWAGVSAEAIAQEVKKELRRRIFQEKKKKERRDLTPAAQLQPRERSLRYDNIRSARAEEGIIRLMLLDRSCSPGQNSWNQNNFLLHCWRRCTGCFGHDGSMGCR